MNEEDEIEEIDFDLLDAETERLQNEKKKIIQTKSSKEVNTDEEEEFYEDERNEYINSILNDKKNIENIEEKNFHFNFEKQDKRKIAMQNAEKRLQERRILQEISKIPIVINKVDSIFNMIKDNKFNLIYFINSDIKSIDIFYENILKSEIRTAKNYSLLKEGLINTTGNTEYQIMYEIGKSIPKKHIYEDFVLMSNNYKEVQSFIKTDFLIITWDRLFGKLGWNVKIEEISYDDINFDKNNNIISIYGSTSMTISTWNGASRENVGSGFYNNTITKYDNDLTKLLSLQEIIKGTFRRVSKDFGNIFGLELYKSQKSKK